VVHDETLARTLGDPRRVGDVRLGELVPVQRPLTLEAVLDAYAPRTRLLIELKDPRPAACALLAAVLSDHRPYDGIVVQSFAVEALRRLRRADPVLPVAPLFAAGLGGTALARGIADAGAYASGIGLEHRSVDAAVIHAARARRLTVRAYTVNDAADMARLTALGVDGIITDRPDRAVALVPGRLAGVAVAA
jgi:glycerophosphoryl diester phosphodiesterase